MRNFITLGILFMIVLCVSDLVMSSELEDVVYLKNGGLVRGIIIEQIPNQTIKIKTKDGNIFVYSYDEIERFTKEESLAPAVPTAKPSGYAKNPTLAFVLSWFVPGTGQLYNGEGAKGAIQFGLVVAGLTAFISAYPGEEDVFIDMGDWSYWDTEDTGNETICYGGLGVALATAVWSMIDAPLSAMRINRKMGYGLNGIQINDRIELALSPVNKKRQTLGPNIALTMSFY